MALGSVRSIGILIVGAVSSHNHCKVLADGDAKKGERERPLQAVPNDFSRLQKPTLSEESINPFGKESASCRVYYYLTFS